MRNAVGRIGELLRGIRSRQAWVRGFFMAIFLFVLWFLRLLITIVAIFQFGALLVAGEPVGRLVLFGQSLARYIQQITLFLTFNSEDLPFPFSPWPEGTGPGEPESQSSGQTAGPGEEQAQKTAALTEKWRHAFTHDRSSE